MSFWLLRTVLTPTLDTASSNKKYPSVTGIWTMGTVVNCCLRPPSTGGPLGSTPSPMANLKGRMRRCIWPTPMAPQLPWVEYANNILTSSTIRISPFQHSNSFQSPFFPAMEKEVYCSFDQALICFFHRTLAKARRAFFHSLLCFSKQSSLYRGSNLPKQTESLDHHLHHHHQKLALSFNGPVKVKKVISSNET